MRDKRSAVEELEVLSDEALKTRLREELDKERIDGETVRTMVHILLRRDAANSQGVPADIKEAWESSQEEIEREQRPSGRMNTRIIWQLGKIAAIAAALCVVVFTVPQALGAKNIVQLIARWSDTTFQFVRPGETTADQIEYVFITDHPGLEEIHSTVAELGVAVPVVPTWVPSGYEMTELTVSEKHGKKKAYARLESTNNSVVLLYYFLGNDDGKHMRIVKDGFKGEVREIDGIIHYYLSNNEERVVTWLNDGIECTISADVDNETIMKILKSIYLKG